MHYLFSIKESQPALLEEIRRVLGERPADTADAVTEESCGAKTVTPRVFLAHADTLVAPEGWTHLRTLVRVDSETRDDKTGERTVETRYFVSSLPLSNLEAGMCSPEGLAANKSGQRLTTVTFIAAAGGLVGLAVGGYLLWTAPDDDVLQSAALLVAPLNQGAELSFVGEF